MRTCQKGFTATEFVVVLALLAVIFLLLVPAINTQREKRNRVVCAGNLQRIGVVILAYANDHQMYLPTAAENNVGGKAVTWDMALVEGGYTGPHVFVCPSDHLTRTGYENIPVRIRSYAISAGHDWRDCSYWIHGARLTCSYLQDSNHIVLVAEKSCSDNLYGDRVRCLLSGPFASAQLIPPYSPHSGSPAPNDAWSQSLAGNYLFVDGHVAWVVNVTSNMFPPTPLGKHRPCP